MSDIQSQENTQNQLLAEEEDPLLKWTGEVIEGEDSWPAKFVATDSRLILSGGEGHFKDVRFQHITSVEMGTDSETEVSGSSPAVMFVIGAVVFLLGFPLLLSEGIMSIIGLIFLIGGPMTCFEAYSDWDEMEENYEVETVDVQNITIRTGENQALAKPLQIKTKENIGAELSRLVQEQRYS